MSSVARWSYTSTATVSPLLSVDDFTGVRTYGPSYTIACTWVDAVGEKRVDTRGSEFVVRTKIWTEDARPQIGDQIALPGGDAQTLRGRTVFDMSPFDEPDSPDFELVTAYAG